MHQSGDDASTGIGLVCADPVASAREAVEFLRVRGYEARVMLDAEPGLPIALWSLTRWRTVINFRKHVTQFPAPE